MYVILGASGNTGSVVANTLLDKGKRVRVVGRDSKRLARFVSRGAEAAVADAADAEALTRAFAGTEGVFALIPPNVSNENYRRLQDQVSEAVGPASEAAGLEDGGTPVSRAAEQAGKNT